MYSVNQKKAFLFEALSKCKPVSETLFDNLLKRIENEH